MTCEKIISQVKEILIEEFEVEPSLLKSEARLYDDLGLDSLDGVDLVVAIEKTFNCRIKEEEARAMETLQHIYDYMEKHADSKNDT